MLDTYLHNNIAYFIGEFSYIILIGSAQSFLNKHL